MSLVGTVRVRCPACGVERDCELVSSINTQTSPALHDRLVRGELNMSACACGKHVQLASNVLFHDPGADYLCQVCPGGEAAIASASEAFRTSGAAGTQRIVPSLNALIEKVKLLDAGLQDWAIELLKILLLASHGVRDLDAVLLFEAIDRDQQRIHWVLFGPGAAPTQLTSPLAAYASLLRERAGARPPISELRIDRAWAVGVLRTIVTSAN
jgi:hypothetical protein